MARMTTAGFCTLRLGAVVMVMFLSVMASAACQGKKNMSESNNGVKEVEIGAKKIELGMGYEQVRTLLGTPDETEPVMLGEKPAIRSVYYRDRNYYYFYFARNAEAKTTLALIDINAGY